MTLKRKQFGNHAEDVAVRFLERRGYKILHRNFRLRFGEIDIIAQDKDTLCFVEVKARTTDDLGGPLESITYFKQRKLSKLALAYLRREYKSLEVQARFDVVAIALDEQGRETVEIIKNAFEVCA